MKDNFFENLPVLLITILIAMTLTVVVLKYVPIFQPASVNVVVFDIIKYTNAQRAVASSILTDKSFRQQQDAETLLLLKDLNTKTKESIAKKAGSNALVLIKQSVVQGEFEDITDAVLTDLGLPTNVPTILQYGGQIGGSTQKPDNLSKNASDSLLP